MNLSTSISTSPAWRKLLSAAACLVFSTSALVAPSQAASPDSGTVTPTASPTWDGAAGKTPTASATCNGPNDPACDNFSLTIDPAGLTSYIVTITLQPVGGDDWDMQVYDPSGGVAGSSGNAPGTAEIVTLSNPPAGVYTVAAAPYAAPLGYAAVATMDPTDPIVNQPGAEQVEFYSYADPGGHAFGEPGAGINWTSEEPDGTLGGDNGGTIMYISGLDTLRIRMNDCTAPATYLEGGEWVERNAPLHLNTLDPIIFTDHLTGRTQSSQLAGKTSLLMWTDVDGGDVSNAPPPVWNASQGAGINSGVDHQTIGGGRLAEPLYSELDGNNPAYNGFAHGVYYCSQDIAIAQCGLSLDGGTTFGPAVPMYNLTQCSGLHGHVDVDPTDGTAYVPNASCGGEQGIAITEDNNTTWRVRTVPNSGGSSSDPSVGIGSEGRVYFGYDNSGSAYAAVSDDKGDTWYNIYDVGASFGIKSTAFPEMIAGDNDRAAMAFLGSTTPSAIGDNPDYPATWHMYVAMTFDGGATWTTTKVDPDDPVQRGTICGGGFGGCDNGTRNLLDFNDIQIDKRGRPVVIYADGCVGACVTDPSVNTLTNLATIARLKSPKGLFAAYDAERSGQPDWPLVIASTDGASVTLNWEAPGDGGNDITGYTVTGPGGLNVALGPDARSYTDAASADVEGAYQVYASNSFGTSRTKPMCSYDVYAGEGPVIIVEDPCDFMGVTVLTDPEGDTTSPVGQEHYDMHRLGISEAEEIGDGNIAFVLTLQSNDVPPNAYYPIHFKDAADNEYWVRMDTQFGEPAFSYGTGAGSNPLTAPGTPAEAGSGLFADNIVRIVVPRAAVGAPNVGDTLKEFIIRARLNLGGVTLTPDNMPDSLVGMGQYTISGSENCSTVINYGPTANSDFATTLVDTPVTIDVLANDSDPENDPLTISGTGKAAHGDVIVIREERDKIYYQPDAGYTGPDSFTYTISDGNGNLATTTVDVDVQQAQGVNDAPIARDDRAKTPPNTPIRIYVLANDSDPNGDPLSIVQVTQPENGGASPNPDGTITYVSNEGYKGTDRFTYTISDGRGGLDSAEVAVKVKKPDVDDGDSDSDSDSNSDSDNSDSDSDSDSDDIADDYDSNETQDEEQGQSGSVAGNSSMSYAFPVTPDTANIVVKVEGTLASMLVVDIIDSSGLLVGTSVPVVDGAMAIASPLLTGDFTIAVRNPTPNAIDYDITTARQEYRQ